MAQMISQVVFKPNPGADMTKLMGLVAESAAIWRKHGAEVNVWTVSAGEIGNMVFICLQLILLILILTYLIQGLAKISKTTSLIISLCVIMGSLLLSQIIV